MRDLKIFFSFKTNLSSSYFCISYQGIFDSSAAASPSSRNFFVAIPNLSFPEKILSFKSRDDDVDDDDDEGVIDSGANSICMTEFCKSFSCHIFCQ